MAGTRTRSRFRPTLVSIAVASCFTAGPALANPTGANVVRGTAAIHQAGNLLQITNSPNAIINWQSFSIGANEITRFIQQSSSSAVLNRVVTQNPSQILGSLQSNGRVFLINPNGILFGAGAQVDVAGLVASTLNMSDQDFLAGRLRFTEGLGKSVVNDGSIATGPGGSVYLIGSGVTNSGIIRSPQGEVVLAAGNSVELVNPGTPSLRVEIAAVDNEARNLGQIISDAGRIGIYAGLINHSGTIRADSVVSEGGRILLKATKNATLEAGSAMTANGAAGGSVTVQSGDTTLVSGTVETRGAEGAGGNIQILGNLVGLIGNAAVDASGEAGGGSVLVGGDFQGKNPDIQNAFRTYVSADATISADAISGGNGGRVIVWSDDATRFYGRINVRGGAQTGDGGFAEVSGKRYLDYQGLTVATAPHGRTGTLLLDPTNITINNTGPTTGSFDGEPFFTNANPATITWTTIKNQLVSSNAIISTSSGAPGSDVGDITIAADSPDLASSNILQLVANNKIFVNARITNTGTGILALNAANGVEQTANGAITANALYANGGSGSVKLDLANNMVNVLTGQASGSFSFRNAKSLEIGSISALEVAGISVNDRSGLPASVNVNVTSGTLNVTQSVSATASTSGQAASIALSAANGVTVSDGSTVQALGASSNGGSGGNGSVGLNGGSGPIQILGGARVLAFAGSANGTCEGPCSGGSATVTLSTQGSILMDGGSSGEANGGGGALSNAGGSATFTATAGGGITITNSSFAEALGGDNFNAGGGGSATLKLTAGGDINISNNSGVFAGAGRSGSGRGGNATVAITSNGGNVTASNFSFIDADGAEGGNATTSLTAAGNLSVLSSFVSALSGGSSTVATGGAATLNATAGGSLLLEGGEGGGFFAEGGSGSGAGGVGGMATINLTAAGGVAVRNFSSVEAFGGSGVQTGGGAAVNVTANGMTFDAGFVGAAGYTDAVTPGTGVVSLNAGPGTIQLMNQAIVAADGSQINLTFSGRTIGGYFVNGVEGAIVDDLLMPTTGFFVNGAPAVLNTNMFVVYAGSTPFIDPLVAAMNTQVDVLADQLKAGDTGEGGEDKEKKKLPFCDG